jgi:hypothetical protein
MSCNEREGKAWHMEEREWEVPVFFWLSPRSVAAAWQDDIAKKLLSPG